MEDYLQLIMIAGQTMIAIALVSVNAVIWSLGLRARNLSRLR